jgi:hypothetical protein
MDRHQLRRLRPRSEPATALLLPFIALLWLCYNIMVGLRENGRGEREWTIISSTAPPSVGVFGIVVDPSIDKIQKLSAFIAWVFRPLERLRSRAGRPGRGRGGALRGVASFPRTRSLPLTLLRLPLAPPLPSPLAHAHTLTRRPSSAPPPPSARRVRGGVQRHAVRPALTLINIKLILILILLLIFIN